MLILQRSNGELYAYVKWPEENSHKALPEGEFPDAILAGNLIFIMAPSYSYPGHIIYREARLHKPDAFYLTDPSMAEVAPSMMIRAEDMESMMNPPADPNDPKEMAIEAICQIGAGMKLPMMNQDQTMKAGMKAISFGPESVLSDGSIIRIDPDSEAEARRLIESIEPKKAARSISSSLLGSPSILG